MLSQIARWCEARLIHPAGGDMQEDIRIVAVRTDTRVLDATTPTLYVALRGERFDGHDFAAEAQSKGAVALLVDHQLDVALPQLLCGDTQAALGELAAGVQEERVATVIALTGSNGKTTVKSLLLAILGKVGRAYANPGNRNNEIGLPLAVIDAPEDLDYAIYEMGAGKPGDIAYLTSIVRPRIALVNNVAPAHLERMGTLLGVAETKGAIYEALPADGVAVINADDAFAPYFEQRAAGRKVLRFGIEASAEVAARELRGHATGTDFVLHTPDGGVAINLPLPGRHNVMNALAAAALALAAGASLRAIRDGLEGAEPVPGRQVAHPLGNGAVLIDDSYNANPGSVEAAIATLASADGEGWLVLGDMAELGEGAEALHAQVGDAARNQGIARLYTVGNFSRAAARAFGSAARHFESKDALVDALASELHAGVRVLVKGSRSSAMDRVVSALLATDSHQPDNGRGA
jgi:UDP-N-acetylmuramoyl-tripeptide--D-alanyl-D-alanine ligase